MTPAPIALGLFVCDRVIVDHESRCPTAVNIFTGLAVDTFPSNPQRLSVFAALNDGQGSGTINLAVVHLGSGDEVFAQQYPIQFPHRGTVVYLSIRLLTLRFPEPGRYEFLVHIDGELIAQRSLRVYRKKESGS